MQKALIVCFTLLIAVNCVTSRWLPTRGVDNRLDRLRELLRDLLESEIEKLNHENKYMYKRDVSKEIENLQMADKTAVKALNG